MNRFQTAGKELVKGNITGALKAAVLGHQINPNFNHTNYRNQNGTWFFSTPIDVLFNFNGYGSAIKAYEQCPPIYSIINYQVNCYINGITTIVNSKGEIATSEKARRINKLRKKPNKLQTEDEFDAQGMFYKRLFGFNIVWCGNDLPVGFDKSYANQMWNIPPNICEFKFIEKAFWETDINNEDYLEIWINDGGKKLKLAKGSYYIFKSNSPNFDSFYLPESPIKSLQKPINNCIGAYDSRYNLIKRRGALGMISSDKQDATGTRPLPVTEKENIQNEYQKNYGLASDQWNILVTNESVKWQQMGYPTKDLMLFEEIEEDIQRMCDAFGHQYALLASNNTNSLGGNKLGESKKLLYQDTIIPLANSDDKQWMNFFNIVDSAETIVTTYNHVAALQEDAVKQQTARMLTNQNKKMEFEAGLITLNNWCAAIGEADLGEDGNIKASDLRNNSSIPLASILGVGGTQSLISVLQTTGLEQAAMSNILQTVFGLTTEQANAMTIQNNNNNGEQQQ